MSRGRAAPRARPPALHLSTGVCEPQHVDPERALELLDGIKADGRILIGPLWPSPGAGRFVDERFVPIDVADGT